MIPKQLNASPLHLTFWRQCRLVLAGVDLIDGTPVLDIKPYLPYDVIPESEIKVPEWVRPESGLTEKIPVIFKAEAEDDLTRIFAGNPTKATLRTFKGRPENFRACVVQAGLAPSDIATSAGRLFNMSRSLHFPNPLSKGGPARPTICPPGAWMCY